MKRQIPLRKETEKLSISLPVEMVAWLRRKSANQLDTVSGVIRKHLRPAFEQRHAK